MHSNDNSIDRLMFLFRDIEGNIMRLNGEFELQLTIEDVYDQVPSSIPSMYQFSMIEVFGKTTKKEVKLDNPLSFDQLFITSTLLFYRFYAAQRTNRPNDIN